VARLPTCSAGPRGSEVPDGSFGLSTRQRAATNTSAMQELHRNARTTNLDFPLGLCAAFRASYAADVIWEAPRRAVTWQGRDLVVEKLLHEAASMQGLQFSRLRQSAHDLQVIDEYVVRFTWSGNGIENLDLPAGAQVELQRLRILTLAGDLVIRETAIETWTALGG
jgi:hypothetical protein